MCNVQCGFPLSCMWASTATHFLILYPSLKRYEPLCTHCSYDNGSLVIMKTVDESGVGNFNLSFLWTQKVDRNSASLTDSITFELPVDYFHCQHNFKSNHTLNYLIISHNLRQNDWILEILWRNLWYCYCILKMLSQFNIFLLLNAIQNLCIDSRMIEKNYHWN